MRFLHIADIHLGYQQYGLTERFNDFSDAYLHLIQTAIQHKVDFVLLAGDFFQKRVVDPLAMRVAVAGLEKLLTARIPVLAVEGNHERAPYGDQFSWVDFLDALGYLCLLNYDPRKGLRRYDEDGGAYLDLPEDVRVYGMKHYGAATRQVFESFAADITKADHRDVRYTILMTHAGVDGEIPHVRGSSYATFAPLKEHVDYIALGHFHKPYCLEDWVYNPGSPETCGMDEIAWKVRGAYLVEVQPDAACKHEAQLLNLPRRPFYRFPLAVDGLTTPNAVYDAVRQLIEREAPGVKRDAHPVIELTLTGTLPFNRYDLDLTYIQALLTEAWSPLGQPHINPNMSAAEFEVHVSAEATRPELERQILQELLERDVRYKADAAGWSEGVLELKRLALGRSSPEVVVAHLRRLRAALLSGTEV